MSSNSAPLARLGRFAHARRLPVILSWAFFAIALGIFAPRLEGALSGAMWEVNGSDSLAARTLIERNFGGFSSQSAVVVIHSDTTTVETAEFQARIEAASAVLASESTLTPTVAPQPSLDGHTIMLQAGSLANPTESVRAAERIADDIGDLGGDGFTVALTGSPAFWADFNAVNREGMQKAELVTWPITAVILVLAFGSLAAAGLPLAPDGRWARLGDGHPLRSHAVHRPFHLDAELRDDVRPCPRHRLRPLHRHPLPGGYSRDAR